MLIKETICKDKFYSKSIFFNNCHGNEIKVKKMEQLSVFIQINYDIDQKKKNNGTEQNELSENLTSTKEISS